MNTTANERLVIDNTVGHLFDNVNHAWNILEDVLEKYFYVRAESAKTIEPADVLTIQDYLCAVAFILRDSYTDYCLTAGRTGEDCVKCYLESARNKMDVVFVEENRFDKRLTDEERDAIEEASTPDAVAIIKRAFARAAMSEAERSKGA